MPKRVLIIDNTISRYGFSKQWLNYMLNGAENDEIELQISSLGGDLDQALAMHDKIASHGNVTCLLTGFVASSATLITLSAKKIRMSENAMYLIHKPMVWINEFNTLNEDAVADFIERLQAEKKELEKLTLVTASMYAKKSGKSVKDILSLMKEETWLTAKTAKEYGFIDEIYSPKTMGKTVENSAILAMIEANELPMPVQQPEDSSSDTIVTKVISGIKSLLTQKPHMFKQFLNLNKTLKVERLEGSEEGVYLNEEQLTLIDQQLSEHSLSVTARQTAENSLTSAISALDTIDSSIKDAANIEAKVNAVKALLAKKPGEPPAGITSKKDNVVNDGVDWDVLNSLPHMQQLD